MRHRLLAAALVLAVATPALAQDAATPPKRKSAKEIIDAAPASAWRDLDPANTLYMELPAGRVVIELAPGFAPEHVANIKALAKGGFWDGLALYRSQDNFVVQWGDADGDDKAKAKPFPAGARDHLPAEFTRSDKGVRFDRLPDADGWAPRSASSTASPPRAIRGRARRGSRIATAWSAPAATTRQTAASAPSSTRSSARPRARWTTS